MRVDRNLPLALAVMLAACAAPPAPSPSPATGAFPEDLPGLLRALEQADRELEGAQPLGTGADCGHACELEQRICELAERICAIAARHPDQVDARDHCNDGRLRCERARARVRAQCTCLDRAGPPERP